MNRFPKILAATCAAVVLSSSLALAAEPAKKSTKPAPAPAQPAAQMGQMGMGMHGQMGGMMGLGALTPEKQELARAIMQEHRDAIFPLHQSMYAKNVELEALNAAGNGESDKAKAVIRDIADLNAKMLIESGKFRTRMIKETGLRTPMMGHGGMMGGMMGGKGCGDMMGGKGMMGGMMGGQPGAMRGIHHGVAAPVAPAPAKADAHSNM